MLKLFIETEGFHETDLSGEAAFLVPQSCGHPGQVALNLREGGGGGERSGAHGEDTSGTGNREQTFAKTGRARIHCPPQHREI